MLRMVLYRKGEKYCTHVLMTLRKTDKMLDKTSDLLLYKTYKTSQIIGIFYMQIGAHKSA